MITCPVGGGQVELRGAPGCPSGQGVHVARSGLRWQCLARPRPASAATRVDPDDVGQLNAMPLEELFERLRQEEQGDGILADAVEEAAADFSV